MGNAIHSAQLKCILPVEYANLVLLLALIALMPIPAPPA